MDGWMDGWMDFLCLTPLSAILWRPVLVVEEAGVPGEEPPTEVRIQR